MRTLKFTLTLSLLMVLAPAAKAAEANPFKRMSVYEDNVDPIEAFVFYVLYYQQSHTRTETIFMVGTPNTENLLLGSMQKPNYEANIVGGKVLAMSDRELELLVAKYESILGKKFFANGIPGLQGETAIEQIRFGARSALTTPIFLSPANGPKIGAAEVESVNILSRPLAKKEFVLKDGEDLLFPTDYKPGLFSRCSSALSSFVGRNK